VKQLCLIALVLCSVFSSGCYLVTQGRPDAVNNTAVHTILPAAIVLAVVFMGIGVAVALQTENNERRTAALGVAGGAAAIFLVLLG
jgi:hypothetical protein